MTEPVPPELLQEVWEYPLFDALYGRRSRRFGLGFAMAEGPYKYRSRHTPLPLSQVEEALLVAAGVGFSGIALWDQSRPMPYRSADGRTFPSTSRGRHTALFFTNDQGVYVIDPSAGSTSKMREAGRPTERDQALDLYRHHRQGFAKPSARDTAPCAAALRAQSVGFEYARLDVVHADL